MAILCFDVIDKNKKTKHFSLLKRKPSIRMLTSWFICWWIQFIDIKWCYFLKKNRHPFAFHTENINQHHLSKVENSTNSSWCIKIVARINTIHQKYISTDADGRNYTVHIIETITFVTTDMPKTHEKKQSKYGSSKNCDHILATIAFFTPRWIFETITHTHTYKLHKNTEQSHWKREHKSK